MASGDPPIRAPLSRRAGAALIDAAIVAPVVVRQVRRRWRGAGSEPPRGRIGEEAAIAEPARMAVPTNLIAEAVKEQLGSPGQWVMGIRTVDRRTGRRVVLWRSLALLAAGWGAEALTRRIHDADPGPAQHEAVERYWRELRELDRRDAGETVASGGERRRVAHAGPVQLRLNLWRILGPGVALTVISGRLRRALAPTVEVRSRGGSSHSP
jgi:hypothetical protein